MISLGRRDQVVIWTRDDKEYNVSGVFRLPVGSWKTRKTRSHHRKNRVLDGLLYMILIVKTINGTSNNHGLFLK